MSSSSPSGSPPSSIWRQLWSCIARGFRSSSGPSGDISSASGTSPLSHTWLHAPRTVAFLAWAEHASHDRCASAYVLLDALRDQPEDIHSACEVCASSEDLHRVHTEIHGDHSVHTFHQPAGPDQRRMIIAHAEECAYNDEPETEAEQHDQTTYRLDTLCFECYQRIELVCTTHTPWIRRCRAHGAQATIRPAVQEWLIPDLANVVVEYLL